MTFQKENETVCSFDSLITELYLFNMLIIMNDFYAYMSQLGRKSVRSGIVSLYYSLLI